MYIVYNAVKMYLNYKCLFNFHQIHLAVLISSENTSFWPNRNTSTLAASLTLWTDTMSQFLTSHCNSSTSNPRLVPWRRSATYRSLVIAWE